MKGKGGGIQQLLKQTNQMQHRMKKVEAELSLLSFKGSSGGGAVSVTVDSESLVQSIEIQPEVFEAGNREMLQDMVMSAVNEAVKDAKNTCQEKMDKVKGDFSIPGLF